MYHFVDYKIWLKLYVTASRNREYYLIRIHRNFGKSQKFCFSIKARFYHLQGTLKGFDQTLNLILDDSHERVYSTTQGVEQVVLGLHIIRGDNVYVFIRIRGRTKSP